MHVTSMAENSAVHSSLLLSLTAELERVARLCMLPSGWTCSPSLRLTPKGASLLVHWSPSLAAEKQDKDKGKRTKRRKRSAASQQRSAERAVLHKARKATVASRQALNPAAAPFVQVPVPPTPNSVPAAGVPAAEESERVGGSMEGASKRAKKDKPMAVSLSSQPGPGPAPRLPATREEWQRELDISGQLLVTAWEKGVRSGEEFQAECRTLDSLAGAGYARRLIQDCELRVRQDRAGS